MPFYLHTEGKTITTPLLSDVELWRLSCSVSPSPLPFISPSLILSSPGCCKLLTCIICTLTVVTEFYNNRIRVENTPLSVFTLEDIFTRKQTVVQVASVFFFFTVLGQLASTSSILPISIEAPLRVRRRCTALRLRSFH